MAQNHKKNIGFVAMRISGTDGVSLEAKKWIDMLNGSGHSCYYFAGEIDLPGDRAYLVAEAMFRHPRVQAVQDKIFGISVRDRELTDEITSIKDGLKDQLREFISLYSIDLLIIQNALAIPMNVPLGIAITETLIETGIPTIAHHHDFFWERDRYLTNSITDYLNAAFPPTMQGLQHVVINSIASEEFTLRTGRTCTLIPNVMDFENPPNEPDDYAKGLRADIGVSPDELMILQPTRIVKRKRIEQAIDLVRRLDMAATLVITHDAQDENLEYEQWLRNYSDAVGVRTLFVADVVKTNRGVTEDGRHIYTLQDMYQNADFVTYPSGREGFGNAFIESVYFKKPIVVNRYSTYRTDIEPKGFKAVELDGFVTEEALNKKREMLLNHDMRQKVVDHNYELGRRYFSYDVLHHKLRRILDDIFGE